MTPKKYTIKEALDRKLKLAMKERRREDLQAYKNIKSEFINKEKNTGNDLDDGAAINLMRSMIKSRKKSMSIFEENGRPDLAEENRRELDILSDFMPAEMSVNDIKYALESIIKEENAYTKKSFGLVMKKFAEMHPNEDNSTVASVLKNILV